MGFLDSLSKGCGDVYDNVKKNVKNTLDSTTVDEEFVKTTKKNLKYLKKQVGKTAKDTKEYVVSGEAANDVRHAARTTKKAYTYTKEHVGSAIESAAETVDADIMPTVKNGASTAYEFSKKYLERGTDYLGEKLKKVDMSDMTDSSGVFVFDEFSDLLDDENIDFDDLYSNPSEKSKKGTTLCSRTAKKNLDALLVNEVMKGDSVVVMRYYEKNKDEYSIIKGEYASRSKNRPKRVSENNKNLAKKLNQTDGLIGDAFTESTSEYGHRVALVNTDRGWCVLDPYIPMINPRKRTRKPIPLENYGRTIESVTLLA